MPKDTQTFELTTWERVMLLNVLGEARGNLATLRRAGKAMDALELSDEDQAEVGFQTVATPQGEVRYQWLDQAHTFTVEIADPEAVAIVKQSAASYEDWSVADLARVEALLVKLGVETD